MIMKLFTLCSLQIIFMTMAYARPQYRVFVDPPIRNFSIDSGVSDIQLTLCFREFDSNNNSLNYCPLGMKTLPVPGPDDPLQFLGLRAGADSIDPEYPVTNGGTQRGFGLLMSATGVVGGNQMVFGSRLYQRVCRQLGQTLGTGFQTLGMVGIFEAFVGADCLPDFTGLRCNTSIPTTTGPPTETITEVITPTPESTTAAEPTTESTTMEEPTTVTTKSTTTEELTTVAPESTTTEEPTESTTIIEEPMTVTTESTITEKSTTVTTENTTTEEPTTVSIQNRSNQSNSPGITQIAAGVGGCVTVLVLLIVLIIVLVLVRRRRKDKGGQSVEYKDERNLNHKALANGITGSEGDLPLYTVLEQGKVLPMPTHLDGQYSDVPIEEALYDTRHTEENGTCYQSIENTYSTLSRGVVEDNTYNTLFRDAQGKPCEDEAATYNVQHEGSKHTEADVQLPTYASLRQTVAQEPATHQEAKGIIPHTADTYYNTIQNHREDNSYSVVIPGRGNESSPQDNTATVYYNATSPSNRQLDGHS